MERTNYRLFDRLSSERRDRTEVRLFGQLTETSQEQQRLFDSYNSRWFKKCKIIIQFYLGVSLVQLRSTSYGTEVAKVGRVRNVPVITGCWSTNGLRFGATEDVDERREKLIASGGIECAPGDGSGRQRWKRLILVCYFMLVLYMTAKFSTLATLQYKFDALLDANRTSTMNNNFSSRNYYHHTCKEPSESVGSLDCARISWLFTVLEYMGNPIVSMNSLGIFWYSIGTVLVWFYFLIPIICIPTIEFRLDNLAFILNPSAERTRIRREAALIGQEMIDSIKRHMTSVDSQSRRYVEMLLDLGGGSEPLVEPASVCANWHRRSARYWVAFLVADSVSAVLIGAIYFLGTVIAELLLRSRVRLQQLGFDSDAFSLIERKGNFYIQLKQLTDTDLEAYRAFDGTTMSYLNLALLVEARYSLTWEKILVVLEMFASTFISVVSGTFYSNVYRHSCIDRIVWANQILGQIEHCSLLLQLARERRLGDPSTGRTKYSAEEAVKISKLLTISYLNFELFRRQQKPQQKLLNFCLIQAFAAISSTIALCYLVGSNLESAYRTPILVVATYMMYLFNIYLAAGAYLTYKIERINLAMMKLLARSVSSSTNWSRSHPIAFWRRQMLDDRGARMMLAPSVLGICLTFDMIVTFDAYLVGLWLVLMN